MYRTNDYPPEVTNVMEVVGSYIINLYYNNFYTIAKQKHEQMHYDSVTDAYRDVIKSFLMSMDESEFIGQFITELKKWYSTWRQMNYIDHELIVNNIVSVYVPTDYFNSFTNKAKDQLFVFIFKEAMKRMAVDIFKIENLRKVCDEHYKNKSNNILYFQDNLLSIMIDIRCILFKRFHDSVVNNGKTDNRTILIDTLKEEVFKLTQENYKIKGHLSKFKALLTHKMNQISNLQQSMEDLKITNSKLNRAMHSMERANLARHPPQEYPKPPMQTPRFEIESTKVVETVDENIPNDTINMNENVYSGGDIVSPLESSNNMISMIENSDSISQHLNGVNGDMIATHYMNPDDLDTEDLDANDNVSEFSKDLRREVKNTEMNEKLLATAPPMIAMNVDVDEDEFDLGSDSDDDDENSAEKARQRRRQKKRQQIRHDDEETVLQDTVL